MKLSANVFRITKAFSITAALSLALLTPAYTEPLDGHLIYHADRYLLGPGDVLSLNVALEPEYSQNEILVGPDGHASIIGVGIVDMKDRTIEDVTAEITTRLKRVFVSPEVSLALTRSKPGIVYLAGAVLHPGMFQLVTVSDSSRVDISGKEPVSRTEMRLTNILTNSGGVMPSADLSQVQVKRITTGETLTLNLWKVLKEGAQDQDVLVNSGDAIFIPELTDPMALSDKDYQLLMSSSIGPKIFPVRVMGEVEKPGVYPLDATSPMLNSAIAMAGGLAPQANRQMVAVRRFTSENSFTTFYVDQNKLDIMLRPNDVIFIPEHKLYKAGRMGYEVARILSPFQTVASVAANSAQVFAFGGWNRSRFGTVRR